MKKVSEQLGIQYYTVFCWRRNRKAEKELLQPILGNNQEIKSENTKLKKASSILNDVLFFYKCFDNDNYRIKRIHKALIQKEINVSRRTVYRTMKEKDFIYTRRTSHTITKTTT